MNRKGFTLVELLATIVILGIIVTIGGVTISGLIKNAKIKEYETLVANIKSAAEMYYQEETYTNGGDGDYSVKLGELLSKGYISSNGTKNCNTGADDKEICEKILINPHPDVKDSSGNSPDISECEIKIKEGINQKIDVIRVSSDNWCPTY